MRPVVVLSEPIHEAGLAVLRAVAETRVLPQSIPAILRRAIADADAVIVRLSPLNGEMMAAAPRLRVIGRHGAGLDNVDLAAATQRNIPVVYVPRTHGVSVAEHTIMLMLALAKHSVRLDQAVRSGEFQLRTEITGMELEGKTLGVVGLGNIGRLVAEKCRGAFGMRVLGYDPLLAPGVSVPADRVADLGVLLRESDVVTLHVPLTAQTRKLLGARQLALMKPTGLVINTSRGEVIDEEALAAALQAGRIAGAAVDVYTTEPPPADHPLLSAPNTVLTPHTAAHTEEALQRMAVSLADDVLAVLRGERPTHVANPEVYAR
jgi:D-3-phosphoglycerate dehydrogenase